MSKKLSVKEITFLGVFGALLIFQGFVPFLGNIRIGLVDVTLLHITVIVGSCLLSKVSLGAILGGIWGITSFINAFSSPSPLAPLLYNPLVSILPRVFVGIVASSLFIWLSKRLNTLTSALITALAGTLTNTLLVLGGFAIFGYSTILSVADPNKLLFGLDPVFSFLAIIILNNTVLELIVAAIAVPVLVKALQPLTTQRKQ